MKRILILCVFVVMFVACGGSGGNDENVTPITLSNPETWNGIYDVDSFSLRSGNQYISSSSLNYFRGQVAVKSNSNDAERMVFKLQLEHVGLRELVYVDSDTTADDPGIYCPDPTFTVEGDYEVTVNVVNCYDSSDGKYYSMTLELTKSSDNFFVLTNDYF